MHPQFNDRAARAGLCWLLYPAYVIAIAALLTLADYFFHVRVGVLGYTHPERLSLFPGHPTGDVFLGFFQIAIPGAVLGWLLFRTLPAPGLTKMLLSLCVFLGLYFVSGQFQQYPMALYVGFMVVWALHLLAFNNQLRSLVMFSVAAGVLGPLLEGWSSAGGFFAYNHPDAYHVPIWLSAVYFNGALTIAATVATVESWRRSPATPTSDGAFARWANRALVTHVLPRLDDRIAESTRPFTRTDLFRPHTDSRLWCWTHFGVFVPDLPAPYRFLNTNGIIGVLGQTGFDNDHMVAADARNTATVLSSTAHADEHHFQAYDTSVNCQFAADGSSLRWGEDLTIEVNLPSVRVRGRYKTFSVDLQLETMPAASWFMRSRAYDHVSLLAPYTGTITNDLGTHPVSGLATVEYARCVSPQSLSKTPLPMHLKVPEDFFTYQIINLDSDTQLLLTDVRVAGASACRLVHLRTRGGHTAVYDDVRFEVLEYQPEPMVDPIGRTMRVPATMRWTVRDGNGEVIRLDAQVDSPLRFGHGRGYVGAFTYLGRFRTAAVAGSGYLEWVDCE